MTLRLIESSFCFDGTQYVYAHWSSSTQSEMRFGIYLPPAAKNGLIPVLYWLSGLTCSEQNFITKAGAQRIASELGIAIVVPDTSPRGVNIPADKMEAGLGEGASFYFNATQQPWDKHYQMYSYISEELPEFIAEHFSVDKERCGIFGHSMGGHGALMIALKNPGRFKSLSAFAPICSPLQSPSGINAFQHYLGDESEKWKEYDACYLMKMHAWPHGEILIDQGSADPLLTEYLKPELFSDVCRDMNVPLRLRMQAHYNHNYYFISSFIDDHVRFHAQRLK